MAGDDPTPRELLIQLQNLTGQVTALVDRVNELTRTLGVTHVPRGEYEEARKGDRRRMDDLEKDIETQAAFRRQVAAGALVGLLLLVANIVIALGRIPGGAS